MKGGDLEQERILHRNSHRKAVYQLIQRHSAEFMELYRAERRKALEKAGLLRSQRSSSRG